MYFGFLDDYYRVPRECDEFPGWVLPVRKEVTTIEEGGKTVAVEKSLVSSAAGVPSKEGSAALAVPSTPPLQTTLPPITNRGATLYQNHESPIDNPSSTVTSLLFLFFRGRRFKILTTLDTKIIF